MSGGLDHFPDRPLQPRVDGLALRCEDREAALVHAPQRLLAHELLERLDAKCELACGERPLCTESELPGRKALELRRPLPPPLRARRRPRRRQGPRPPGAARARRALARSRPAAHDPRVAASATVPVLPFTRAVYVAGVCLTAGTGVGLFAVPDRTEDYWAWTIKAPLTAAFFGAGYNVTALSLAL